MKKIVISLIILSCQMTYAKTSIKLATLVPKGTSWANTLKDMTKEIKTATDGEVRLKIYYGGTQGDEPDVLRKLRIGQLHGGIFTGKTLSEIYSDIRNIEIPFNFYHDDQKALKAIQSQESFFNKGIESKNFVNLGIYGIGKVYVVSSKKVTSIEEMKGVKMWAWEGDQLIAALMESLGLVSVPLAITDVTSSLSTGMIDAAYAPPLGIVALQWQNKIKYLIDFPTAYSIGALVVTKKIWSKLSKEHQDIVMKISKKYVAKANELAVSDNEASLKVLKENGVELIQFSKEDLANAESIRTNVIERLRDKVISSKAIKRIEDLR